MGTFKSSKLIAGSPALIPGIEKKFQEYFFSEGYEIKSEPLISGGYDISVSKGDVFKAVLGMKSALKIVIRPQQGQIYVEAGVGIFGQQAIPTVITVFFFWPVLVTQIWGLIQQSKIDDKVIEIAEEYVRNSSNDISDFVKVKNGENTFCTNCGSANGKAARFCSNCGSHL